MWCEGQPRHVLALAAVRVAGLLSSARSQLGERQVSIIIIVIILVLVIRSNSHTTNAHNNSSNTNNSSVYVLYVADATCACRAVLTNLCA